MDHDTIDWTRPIMFEDGRFCRYAGGRWTDAWIEHYATDAQGNGEWRRSVYSERGAHIRYSHEPRLPRVVYQPHVDMNGALHWLDNGDRAFVREKFWKDYSCTGYSVDDPTGRLYLVLPNGSVQGLPPRVLGNVPNDQLMAEGRLAIKKAQAERARRREQAAIEQLEDLNPTLFGSF